MIATRNRRCLKAMTGLLTGAMAAALVAGCVPPRRSLSLPPDLATETLLPSTTRFVFFDAGAAALDDAAQAAIDRFLADLAAGRAGPETGLLPPGPAHDGPIRITGHADAAETPGSAAAALRLAERRAHAVAAHLHRAGIPPERIEITVLGTALPLLPAADGVPEPANRRVELAPADDSAGEVAGRS